jgi:hypothetical protein
LLKAGIEGSVPPENRKLVRELRPVLKKMKTMLEDLYYDNDDDDTDGLRGVDLPNDNLKGFNQPEIDQKPKKSVLDEVVLW